MFVTAWSQWPSEWSLWMISRIVPSSATNNISIIPGYTIADGSCVKVHFRWQIPVAKGIWRRNMQIWPVINSRSAQFYLDNYTVVKFECCDVRYYNWILTHAPFTGSAEVGWFVWRVALVLWYRLRREFRSRSCRSLERLADGRLLSTHAAACLRIWWLCIEECSLWHIWLNPSTLCWLGLN